MADELPVGVYETEDGRYVNEDGRYVDPVTGNPLKWNPLMGGNTMLDAVMGVNSTAGMAALNEAAGLPEGTIHRDLPYTVAEDGHFYNDDGERLYFWEPSGEQQESERREHNRHVAEGMMETGTYRGGYYTLD